MGDSSELLLCLDSNYLRKKKIISKINHILPFFHKNIEPYYKSKAPFFIINLKYIVESNPQSVHSAANLNAGHLNQKPKSL